MTAVLLAFEMIAMISVGIFIRKRGIVSEDFGSSLTAFLLNISLPCMIVGSLQMPFSYDKLGESALLLGISVLLLLVYFLLGQLVYVLLGKGAKGRTARFGTIFTNFTFMGIPVIEALYGQEGLFAFVIFVIPFRLAYYSSAKPLLSPMKQNRSRAGLGVLRGFLTPPVAAALTGLLLYTVQITIPAPIGNILNSIGSTASPLGMILCGISLAEFSWREFRAPRLLAVPLFCNVAKPAITALLVFALPIDPLVKKIIVVFAALPVASLLAAFTLEYDLSPDARQVSSATVFFSTVLSALTVPFWAFLAELMFL